MENKMKWMILAFLAVLMCSCSSYYQVYQADSSDPSVTVQGDNLVFEDANCKIYYNFGKEAGDISFYVFNKTDQNLYLDLRQSSFILNAMAFDNYQPVTYSNSASSPDILKGSNSRDMLYHDRDLDLYPLYRQSSQKTFSEEESAIVFSNRITYSLEHSKLPIHVENDFFVSKISNCTPKEMFD